MTTTSTPSSVGTEMQSLPNTSEHEQRVPRRLSVTDANALVKFNELLAQFRDHRLVIFLDYDGTLTPIVNDPALALLSPATKDTLEKLRTKFTTGVISGRSLRKIQKFVGIPQLHYAGSHGFDIEGPDGTSIKNQVAEKFLPDVNALRDELKEQIKHIPGAEVEDNVFSISLHYRNVDPGLKTQISSLAHSVRDRYPLIRMNEGKMVYEYKPKMDWNKGKALLWLLQALGLDKQDNVFTIYIGDDTTDEDAFRLFQAPSKCKGVGIIVAEESLSTDASFTLRDTVEVRELLNRLVDHASNTPNTTS
ncbi:putative HAD-superfamily hydrolase, subfamily IIB, HAD superfamily [Plasmopara halstedii]